MFEFGHVTSPKGEAQYFQNHHPDVTIPVTDVAAYGHYPEYRWLFNKLQLCDAQGVWAYPDRYPVQSFPVFHKPITNLYGMSTGAQVVTSEIQYKAMDKPGYMVMPFLRGDQYTTDVALLDGEIVWTCSFLAHKSGDICFLLFEKVTLPLNTLDIIERWINRHFPTYTGIINIEMIGDVVIESPPRMSTQYVDLYGGDRWLQSVISLYEDKRWDFVDNMPETAYSVPLRIREKDVSCTFSDEAVSRVLSLCSSFQDDTNDTEPPADDDLSERIAVVNAFDLDNATKAVQTLKEGLITNKEITWIQTNS